MFRSRSPRLATVRFDTSPATYKGAGTSQSNLPTARPLLMLLVFVVALTSAGAYLAAELFSHGSRDAEVAHLGEPVEVPGGLLRVDRVIPEHLAPMHNNKFGQSGMSMSAMGIDVPPKGYRRFTVEITLAAEARAGLHSTAGQFHLTGKGMSETGTLRHRLGDGVIPSGSASSGSLTFQVPETASDLQLSFRGGERPIALPLGPASHSDDHESSNEAESHGDGHTSHASTP